jgi:hypothetical protein
MLALSSFAACLLVGLVCIDEFDPYGKESNDATFAGAAIGLLAFLLVLTIGYWLPEAAKGL